MFCNSENYSRWWMVVAAGLILFSGFLTDSDQYSFAQVPEVGGQAHNVPASIRSILVLQVNYAQDWVAGTADPGDPVDVILMDNLGTKKAEAVVVADGDTGDFFIDCANWFAGWCPDIVPGDRLFVSTVSESGAINPIGAILVDNLDISGDTVSGTLDVKEFGETQLNVQCGILEEMGPNIDTQAIADGGTFSCDFDGIWDIQPEHAVAISYEEPDGDRVTTIATLPWMRVNLKYNQVGGNYPAGQTLTITVRDSVDAVKATAAGNSEWSSGWVGEGFETEEGDWVPMMPDIQPGDKVHIAADNGYTHTVTAGTIDASVDAANDTVSGRIYASSFSEQLTVACHPWGAWEAGINDAPIKESSALPDGSDTFLCEWDPVTEWDMQPGQAIAVMYVEPDDQDRVIDVFEEPAPYLLVEKEGFGELAQGGNAHYRITLWNDGSGPAEDVLLTDYLDGLTYLADTSGLAHSGSGSGPIVWVVGTVDPGQTIQFDLFTQVTASASDVVTNTISVSTSTTSDQGEAWEKSDSWVNYIYPNDTHLHVNKTAWTDNPAPDQDVVFVLEACNDGSTGSTAVTLSDELGPGLSLESWWCNEVGWIEESSDSNHLSVVRPAIASGECSRVYLRAHVAPSATLGQVLTNTVLIDAANDLSPDDNQATWEGEVDVPRKNVSIYKNWERGQLVPGGVIHYILHYQNTGNVPMGKLVLTDTFPVGTTFVGAWYHDPWGRYPFVPKTLTNEYAVWEIPGLENGFVGEVEVTLAIDAAVEPGTVLVNRAEIDPLTGETDVSDNQAEWREMVYPSLPNLRIHTFHEWRSDSQLIFQIQFENIGSEPVSDIIVTDILPLGTEWDGWELIEFDLSRLNSYSFNQSSRTFRWDFSEILPGESGWIWVRANLSDPGTPLPQYTNIAEITLPDGDPSPEDNYAETTAYTGGEDWFIYLPLILR